MEQAVDNVGLLLRGISRTNIQRGQVQAMVYFLGIELLADAVISSLVDDNADHVKDLKDKSVAPSKELRLHWDLNTIMDECVEPCDDLVAERDPHDSCVGVVTTVPPVASSSLFDDDDNYDEDEEEEPRTTKHIATPAKGTNDFNPIYAYYAIIDMKTSILSRSQLGVPTKDKVLPNTSQVKFTKTEVEDHHRISSISNQTKSVTACNDILNSRTSNVNAVCATCRRCVFNSNHDACVSKFLNDVNARTKKPNVVPISTRKPKSQANKSVATPHKKTVASESTTTNSKSYYRMLYKKTSKAWKWWIAQQCPSAYTWVPKTKKKWVPKVRNESVTKTVSFAIDNIVQLMTHNLSLLCNFVEKYLGTVRFGNDQFAPILGYGDLVQGNITINRVYYVEGLNHNLFSVGQFCDADLEVAFRKSTCFVRDLQGNNVLTTSPTQAWLWHQRLSHLNFDYINLLTKKDVVIGLPKLKYVKDQLCSSCEVSKAKGVHSSKRLSIQKDG
ncbi:retrovirus-related pol polyprotein from transposon TNT 1-94 [Tanacetum coccineum]